MTTWGTLTAYSNCFHLKLHICYTSVLVSFAVLMLHNKQSQNIIGYNKSIFLPHRWGECAVIALLQAWAGALCCSICLLIPELKPNRHWLPESWCSHHRSQELKKSGNSRWLLKSLFEIFTLWLMPISHWTNQAICARPKLTKQGRVMQEKRTFKNNTTYCNNLLFIPPFQKTRHIYTQDIFLPTTEQPASSLHYSEEHIYPEAPLVPILALLPTRCENLNKVFNLPKPPAPHL